jgi:hypothetical protein
MEFFVARLTSDEHSALVNAINSGVLAQRHRQLTEMLINNRGYFSIANGIEREIEALISAANALQRAERERP